MQRYAKSPPVPVLRPGAALRIGQRFVDHVNRARAELRLPRVLNDSQFGARGDPQRQDPPQRLRAAHHDYRRAVEFPSTSDLIIISGPMPAGSPIVTAMMLVTHFLLNKVHDLQQGGFRSESACLGHYRPLPATTQKIAVRHALRHPACNMKSAGAQRQRHGDSHVAAG